MNKRATAPLIGKVISDRYEIKSEIGSGIFGTVFLGFHRQMEKPIAVKVLYQQVEPEDRGFVRFQREAQLASGLNHPNIIKIYDFGMFDDGRPYIVMDFIEGPNLRQILDSHKRLSLTRALPIFLQLCDALSHIHRAGFLHRDLKPDNVILRDTPYQRDFVTLVDFGIAKRLNEPMHRKLTVDGTVVGTPAYMSPEQILGNKLDVRSDIYSMGILMFRVLTGTLPIRGKNSVETMTNHVSCPPLTLLQACPGIAFPHSLNAILMTALRKNPEERQKTMDQLYCELKACKL